MRTNSATNNTRQPWTRRHPWSSTQLSCLGDSKQPEWDWESPGCQKCLCAPRLALRAHTTWALILALDIMGDKIPLAGQFIALDSFPGTYGLVCTSNSLCDTTASIVFLHCNFREPWFTVLGTWYDFLVNLPLHRDTSVGKHKSFARYQHFCREKFALRDFLFLKIHVNCKDTLDLFLDHPAVCEVNCNCSNWV